MDPTPWVQLSIERRGSQYYRCAYRDNDHNQDLAPEPTNSVFLQMGTRTVSVDWPQAATKRLMDSVANSTRSRFGRLESVPLAVLIKCPRDHIVECEGVVAALLGELGIASQKVCLATLGPSVGPHDPITVPFKMAITKLAGRLSLTALQTRLGEGLEIKYGLSTEAAANLRRSTHVLVASSSEFDQIVGSGQKKASPALIILTRSPEKLPVHLLPRSSSLLAVQKRFKLDDVSQIVDRLLTELSHDLGLHEAVHRSLSKLDDYESLRRDTRFVTTPEGLDSLRLSPALDKIKERLRVIARYSSTSAATVDPQPPPSLSKTIKIPAGSKRPKLGEGFGFDSYTSGPMSNPGLWLGSDERAAINKGIDNAVVLVPEFRQERTGLRPMAESERWIRRAEEAVAKSAKRAARSVSSMTDAEVDLLVENHNRRATLWVSDPEERTKGLGSDRLLAHAHAYQLNVGIGIDWETDLVPTDAPAIDPALPPIDDDLELEVVAFSAESQFPNGGKRTLKLGKFGPSEVVEIPFVTPKSRTTTNIRVGFYHDHHLVQLLNLRAGLSKTVGYSEKPGLVVKVLFTRAANLTRFDQFKKQSVLAIAGNSTGTKVHRLMFDTGDNIPFSEAKLAGIQSVYRTQLKEVWGSRRVKLPREKLDEFIKQMAFEGYALWDDLFSVAEDELSEIMWAIAQSQKALTVQYVRVQATFSFPWTMLYDRELPMTQAERDKMKVCLGLADGGNSPCAHGQNTGDVVCVRGFWGVRHVIQEFVKSPQEQPVIDQVVSAAGAQALGYTIGTSDKWTGELETRLKRRYGSKVAAVARNESVFDVLNPNRRPAVFFVIGHLSNDGTNKNLPIPPRIQVGTDEAWINSKDRRWRTLRSAAKGSDAHPVVFLLACGSGESELTKLPDFLIRLGNIGASAVIATEEKIDTDLAAEVAERILADIAKVGPGESLRRWRADALAEGNPYGFLFRCFGNAHVRTKALV